MCKVLFLYDINEIIAIIEVNISTEEHLESRYRLMNLFQILCLEFFRIEVLNFMNQLLRMVLMLNQEY